MKSELKLNHIVVLKPADCLKISGALASFGKLSTTLEIALLTSFATSSISRLSLKVISILDLSSSLIESIETRPGVPPIKSSIFCVI